MKYMKTLKILACVMGAFAIAGTSALAEMRTWTAADGRTLEAEFLGVTGAGPNTNIKLRTAAGQEYQFPLSKLSKEDQLWAKAHLPKDPHALAAEIDKLVLDKMKEAYYGLREEYQGLAANTDLTAAEKKKRAEELAREMEMCAPNDAASDEQFMRRVYLDIAGRIPTFKEADAFLNNRSKTRRADLINELLDSDAFAMRMYNWYSDLLRIREGVFMMGNGDIKADPYIEWIKQSVKEDKKYDEMVAEMLAATGKIWDNPATGYILSDSGMRLCNLSNTFTIFMGTEITCAQCHDHPFEEVYQMDFYKMAAFMGETETRARGRGNMMMMMEGGGGGVTREELARMNKLLLDAGKLRENDTTDRQLNRMVGTHSINVNDTGRNVVKLPHDYKYDDGDPSQSVDPGTYFGDIMDLEKYETPRQAFADWVTSENNPRFTVNVVNRLWKMAFGLAQIEPVYNIPGHLDGQAQNPKLLAFLEEMMKDLDYSVRDFMRVVYNTNAYQREAEHLSPTLTQIDKGTFHFPGPVLRRMSAEQMWDSFVTLTTEDPDAMVRRGWEEYKEIMHFDTTQLKTADQVWEYRNRIREVGRLVDVNGDASGRDVGKVGRVQMVRASEMRQPQAPGHFLRMFGQSDKQLIENQFTSGSSPQVMNLLNGQITNEVLTSPEAYLVKEIMHGEKGSKGDKIDKIFLSVLGRYPTSEEKSKASAGMSKKVDRDAPQKDKDAAEAAGIGNLIWALVNTREFMFIQ
ncbi:MAG: DUF1549 domain-containing protein [Verrucomicrobiales bacterium]|nr:DUF1549 domain-containing protein [Verrucomicrobiales bacterium]